MRRVSASLLGLCLGLLTVLTTPLAALAAPLPAAYSGSAGGDVVALDLTVGGVPLADARLAVSQSDIDSTATPESTASAFNLAAGAVGVGLTVNDTTQTAPPDNTAPETETIVAAEVTGLLTLGALETSVLARYAGDDVCVPGGTLADSQVDSAGITVAPTGIVGILETGDASTRGVVDLVPEPAGDPLNRAVRSTAIGTITGTSFLGGAVDVEIDGPSTLTAIATGEPGGASVEYDPGTVTVTVDGEETVVAVGATETFTVTGVGEVDITVNQLDPADVTESADGQTATGKVSVVTAVVRVGPELAPTATATIDLLPLRAEAVAPPGGIDCPPPPPVLTTPADGSHTFDTTPTFTGTAEPGSTVTIFVDGEPIGTTTAADDGTFTFTPDEPLPPGDHEAYATATVNGAESQPSNTNDFTIAPRPVLNRPADGSATDDTTPTFTGTAAPGSTVEIFVDGESIGTTTANPDGTFSFTPDDPLDPGEYEAFVTATVNGVESGPSDTNDFTINDTDAPAPPVITSPDDGSTTTDPTPVIRGTGEPGSTVIISIDGEEVGSAVVDEDGNFTFVPTEPLSPGEHVVTAVAVDDAGNQSGPSEPVEFTVVTPDDGTDSGTGGGSGAGVDSGTGSDTGTGGTTDAAADSLADTGGPAGWLAAAGTVLVAVGARAMVLVRRQGRHRTA